MFIFHVSFFLFYNTYFKAKGKPLKKLDEVEDSKSQDEVPPKKESLLLRKKKEICFKKNINTFFKTKRLS